MTSLAEGTRRVREAANIATVIGQYTPLRKIGQEIVGLCCFHRERSPSMSVNPAKGLFHCHGCGKGGDVLTFIQQVEGLPFLGARTLLAEQWGVDLDDRPLTQYERERQARQRAYDAQRGRDAETYWDHVLRRYKERFQTILQIAFGCRDMGLEDVYQGYARRAWRWGKIIRRLEKRDPEWLLRAFGRVRQRREVVRLVEAYRQAEAGTAETWRLVMEKAGTLSEEQIWTVAAAAYTESAEMAREVLAGRAPEGI